MSLHQRDLIVNGNNWGIITVFDKEGDEFAVHTHPTEEENHITIVLFGSIKLIGDPSFDGTIIEARSGGTIVHLPAAKPHGFVAMSDGATIANIKSSLCPL